MEVLAGIFLSLVTTVNTLAPQANIPQVLGIRVASESTTSALPSDLLEMARIKRLEVLENQKRLRSEKIASIAANIKERKEEFKERLAGLKDERKQAKVDNVAKRLEFLNEKWVAEWNKMLTRLSEILAKIEDKTNEAAASGKDTASTTAAIALAKSAISEAQTAVDLQSTKTYVITLNEEDTLRSDVETTTKQFKIDIEATKTSIKEARQAVVAVFRTLKEVVGE